ncbi:RNA-guided endonuclease TnpB family protein [Saliphagus sp. LR7]|uniref:RNA-guided endonuclease InsQ/TnpB family protein n=1 Tax=Saliphagus sp. LR7 TaxID=2282654 RepID=UPI000DF77904|nr:RNA-guided endonuclease TnpB family protein [Saliphagus sp. LR7]
MAKRTVTRTHVASIRNYQQVRDGLDSLGFAASKLWNVARWTIGRIWDETGTIPGEGALKSYLKSHERYADLNAQSSQAVLEELSEAFTSWYGHRQNGNQNANPPGYRKHGDDHPRSTVTFKEDGFTHDATNGRLRLSKGRNLKAHWSDFLLCEYETRPDVEIENVQLVRAVYERGEWCLHIVCRHEIETESPGNRTAGIDLGICNFATVSYGNEATLYPGGALKEDSYYFTKERAKCDDSSSREARRLDRKQTERRSHFLHALSKHIVSECVERGVGTIVIGDLGGIRDDENGDARNWGDHGNLDLHGWAFDRFTSMLEYKGEGAGIEVVREPERATSQTCSACEMKDGNQRVGRGLYVCDSCGTVANADVNGAENIRRKVLPNLATDGGDRDNGWMAQPAVRLFDRSEGRFAPREQVADREP